MEKCPVCAREPLKKNIKRIVDGVLYSFCCEECKSALLAQPRKYINCCRTNESGKESDDNGHSE